MPEPFKRIRSSRSRYAARSSQMPPPDIRADRAPRADRYRLLLEASRTLGATLGTDELYEAIYRETARAMDAPGFFLAVHDQGRDLARVVYMAEDGVGERVDVAYRGSDSQVITTQKAAIFDDDLAEGSLMSLGEGERSTRSGVIAPLLHAGRVIGAISAQSYEPGTYDEHDLDMLQEIAAVAAVAMFNAQQFAELQRRRKEAEQLEEIGRALTSKLDPDQVLRVVISAVSDVLDVDGVAIWLCDPRRPAVCRVADSGGEIALPIGLEWELDGRMQKQLLDVREPVVLDNLAVSDALPPNVAEHLTGGSAVGVPLILGGTVDGVLTVGSRRARRFSRADIEVLRRLASQVSVALGNARMHANLHALSLTDPLTGLPNRRRLQIHLDHEVAAARRGRPMAIAIFDIDSFKTYNDTFGHIAGDEVLKAVGNVMSQENRAMNVVARYGGDEFVSVLSETGIEGAKNFAERVLSRLAEHETLKSFGVTMSVGYAEFDPDEMTSVNDVLRAADASMYENKAKRQAERLKTGS